MAAVQQVISPRVDARSAEEAAAELELARQRDEEARRAAVEQEALQRAGAAREAREARERARDFMTEHGYRHLRAKCNHRARGLSQTYPLFRAVWCNDADMVELLLRLGADPSQQNGWGQTPLEYAQRRSGSRGHDARVVEALREAGSRASTGSAAAQP